MTSAPTGAGTVVQVAGAVGGADDVTELVVELSRLMVARCGDTPVLTVVARLSGPEPWCAAAGAAVRGFVQSAALDLAPELRCNLVLAGPDSGRGSDGVDDAVAYLERVGPPAIGMTIDLRAL